MMPENCGAQHVITSVMLFYVVENRDDKSLSDKQLKKNLKHKKCYHHRQKAAETI